MKNPLPNRELVPYLLAEAAERNKLDEDVNAIMSGKIRIDPIPEPIYLKTLAEWVYEDEECCNDITKFWSDPNHKMGHFEEALMTLILEREKE